MKKSITLGAIIGAATLISTQLVSSWNNDALAADANATVRVAYNTSFSASHITSAEDIILSAPPLQTPEEGRAVYEPVAKYLSKALNKTVTYRHPGTWLIYRTEMLKGNYDLVFDDAHLGSYRMEKMDNNILVKTPDPITYTVFVRKNNHNYKRLKQLAGRTVCANSSPHLATLMVNIEFTNPARQMNIQNTEGWDHIYRNVQLGNCIAGIIPTTALNRYDPARNTMRGLYKTRTFPNQAFTASPRISRADQRKIAQALLSNNALIPTARLRDAFQVGDSFAPASNKDFVGLAQILRNEWGYY